MSPCPRRNCRTFPNSETRAGRRVFRRKGHKTVTIKGVPGSSEFLEAYQALLEHTGGDPPSTIGNGNSAAGTIDADVIAYFKHEVFTGRPCQGNTESLAFDPGTIPRSPDAEWSSLRRQPDFDAQEKPIRDFLDGKRPNAQKNSLKAIRGFVRFAIYTGKLGGDPTENIKPVKPGIKSRGHMTWLEPQLAQYRERWPLGTVARLAVELLLNIAARRYDAHEIGELHVKAGNKLVWRPHKTLRSTGKLLSIKIRPELQTAIDAIPQGTRAEGVVTFLVNDYGRPFASAAEFGNKFADWCRAAELKAVKCDDGKVRSYRAHGLRKAALLALAAGATGVELMAVSGHSRSRTCRNISTQSIRSAPRKRQ